MTTDPLQPAGFDALQRALPEYDVRIELRNFDRAFALLILDRDGREVASIDGQSMRCLSRLSWRQEFVDAVRRSARRRNP
ncbi:hypothetical protein [Zeimonas arvi]|uniref:DUF3509 domain-containing protein n=1 Tax=Zeimonas arvi TaxID=2498847 RepID=A0A5C8P1P7_9BURK|nr:hypothetical protein [Zeimonas arvi]TXL67264.1 hypothetical protein FHP08_06555 [Zeimonas arvi]